MLPPTPRRPAATMTGLTTLKKAMIPEALWRGSGGVTCPRAVGQTRHYPHQTTTAAKQRRLSPSTAMTMMMAIRTRTWTTTMVVEEVVRGLQRVGAGLQAWSGGLRRLQLQRHHRSGRPEPRQSSLMWVISVLRQQARDGERLRRPARLEQQEGLFVLWLRTRTSPCCTILLPRQCRRLWQLLHC